MNHQRGAGWKGIPPSDWTKGIRTRPHSGIGGYEATPLQPAALDPGQPLLPLFLATLAEWGRGSLSSRPDPTEILEGRAISTVRRRRGRRGRGATGSLYLGEPEVSVEASLPEVWQIPCNTRKCGAAAASGSVAFWPVEILGWNRDVQMEAAGDTAVPAPGGEEDLENTRFSSEEAGDSAGVHASTPDPGDEDPEETGSKAKDQPPSLLSPLPQAEAPSSTCEPWNTEALDNSPTQGPESSSEGQGGDPSGADPSGADPSDEDWRSQRKHVFVLSEAGKPIYSRYGSVEALSATMGVMTALVSFVQSAGDAIRAIYAEDHKLVFLQQGPLLLVAVSRTPQSAAQLRGELLAVHAQIVSTLTRASVARIFAHKQNYDLRRLLAGSERTLDRLLDTVERDPGALLLGAVRCVPLARPLREALGTLLRRCTAPGLALSVLAVGGRLITAAQERNVLAECRLDPADLQLLLDWVCAPAFAAGEAWAPVCLPRFNPDGFFYAYVARLDSMPVCLLLLGTNREAFHAMAACRRMVEDGMHALGALRALGEAANFSSGPAASAPAYSVQAVGAPALRHFLYKPLDIPDQHRQLPQFTSPELEAPYSREEERQRLSDLYHRLHARLHSTSRPLRLIYHVAEKETLLAWVTSKFELYTCLSPLVTKGGAILAVTKLLRWVRKEEDRLFIRYPPKYSTPPATSVDQAPHNGLFPGL